LEVDNIYWLHLLFIMLMVIYAAVSAVVSPQAPLTRALFCGLTLLIDLFNLLGASLSLDHAEDSLTDVVGGRPEQSVPVSAHHS
jgi:hypothetical protein